MVAVIGKPFGLQVTNYNIKRLELFRELTKHFQKRITTNNGVIE